MNSNQDMRRILCLDGGGIWCLLQVMALQKLFEMDTKGHEILNSFDLVAANSGGSIVLGGLVENRSLDEMLSQFLDRRITSTLFVPEQLSFAALVHKIIRYFFHLGPKYQTDKKLEGLLALLPSTGGKKMSELKDTIYREHQEKAATNIFIVGYDYDWRRARFFSSAPSIMVSNADPDDATTLAEAIHASSTAPLNWFNAPAVFGRSYRNGKRFWDGAVTGHNNPVLAAVTEAMATYHPVTRERRPIRLENIHVLSIGAGTVSLPVVDPETTYDRRLVKVPQDSSLARDTAEMLGAIGDDPPDAATFEAYVMLGNEIPDQPDGTLAWDHETRLVRMNPLVRPKPRDGKWVAPEGLAKEFKKSPNIGWRARRADDASLFRRLTKTDMDGSKRGDAELVRAFGQLWLDGEVANQPIKENHYTFKCQIGQTTFVEALQIWRQTASRASTHSG